jgi:M6 family metalloprotease-like protein
MNKHRGLVLAFILFLTIFSISSVSSAAPQIIGSKCAKAGSIRTAKNVKYQCKKSAKGLRWVAASTKKTPTKSSTTATTNPSNTTPKSQISSQSLFSSVESCKDLQRTVYVDRQTRVGYPKLPGRVRSHGRVDVLMLPVDFPDAVAKSDPRVDIKKPTATVNKFYSEVSLEKLSFNFRTLDRYIRIPQNSTHWGITAWGFGNSPQFIKDIVAFVDDQVDFSGVEILVVMPPPNIGSAQIAFSPAQVYSINDPLMTNEGPIFNATQMGNDAWNCCEGLLLAHEIGHHLGWIDLNADVGQWDFMGWANTPGLFGWHRLYQDWLTSEQVLCMQTGIRFNVWLRPLGSKEQGIQLLLFRGKSGALVAAEVRRPSDTDKFVTTRTQGVLIYSVQTDVAQGISVRGNRLDRNGFLPEAPLQNGEELVFDGWSIRVIESGTFGDVIEVTPN